MVIRSCSVLPFTRASRVRRSPGQACCKCLHRENELWAAMLSLQLVTTIRSSDSWSVIHGALAGAKEVISRCLTLICSRKTFQTTFGRFVWFTNLYHLITQKMPKYWDDQ